ncbi:dihydrofolate reductase, partial [Bacillus toyonensis]
EEEIFIFGGAQIYDLFLPYVDKLYITKIHHAFEGAKKTSTVRSSSIV